MPEYVCTRLDDKPVEVETSMSWVEKCETHSKSILMCKSFINGRCVEDDYLGCKKGKEFLRKVENQVVS
jgi:hypothetical protein